MNTKEYIQSGVLELYASGALNESEAREVEAMAAAHPEVKAELAAIQDALITYSASFRRNPRPELRSAVLNRIDEVEGVSKSSVLSNQDSRKNSIGSSGTQSEALNYVQQQPARFNYLMAAVWLFLILNIAGNVYFYTKLNNTEAQLVGLVNESAKLRMEYEKIKFDMDKKSTDLKMVMNRSNKVVDMKGMDIAPQSFATVYWNPNTKQVMLNVNNLPMPPADKQYQLWALKDGKPIDAGVFDMKPGPAGEMHMMPVNITDADAFAVTLENKGGSPVPTLTQLYVMGKI